MSCWRGLGGGFRMFVRSLFFFLMLVGFTLGSRMSFVRS